MSDASPRLSRLRQRWQNLLPEVSPDPVLRAYDHPSRAYHNLEHLEEVLEWTDRLPLPQEERDRLARALFYHDAIYDSHRSDNEQASADWALQDLGQPDLVPLILDTRHAAAPQSSLGEWMVDVDLAILGADPRRFDRYNADVRKEYQWVPNWLYRRKRRQLLKAFLKRKSIYHTSFFRERLEQQARANLQRACAEL